MHQLIAFVILKEHRLGLLLLGDYLYYQKLLNAPKTHHTFSVSDFFPCSGSNMNVSETLVCDGYYNCDNYEDESSCSK